MTEGRKKRGTRPDFYLLMGVAVPNLKLEDR